MMTMMITMMMTLLMTMMITRSSLSSPAVRVVTNEEARSPLLATAIAQPSYEEDYDGDHEDHEGSDSVDRGDHEDSDSGDNDNIVCFSSQQVNII